MGLSEGGNLEECTSPGLQPKENLVRCYNTIPAAFFERNFVLDLREYLKEKNTNQKINGLKNNLTLVEKCIFEEVTEKFGFFL